jgi:molybdate transport system substrate-binding protein
MIGEKMEVRKVSGTASGVRIGRRRSPAGVARTTSRVIEMAETRGAINLLTSNGMHAVLDALLPEFRRTTGHDVSVRYGTGQEILERIAAGETADVVIANRPSLENLARAGKLDAASVRDLAASSVGVAVRSGLAKPDVSSVEAFKRALLAADSIAFTGKGASGMHFARLIETLGIAKEVRAKAVMQDGGLVGELVVQGRATMAIQQIPELLAVAGLDFVGPLPDEIQLTSRIAAGVFAGSPRPAAATALVAHLASAQNGEVYRAKGMQTPHRGE